VPSGSDQAAGLSHPSIQGRKPVSDRATWFLSWEGDPTLQGGRSHPLGIMVETRGLAFKSEGAQDTSAANPAAYDDAPHGPRPG
jgi:hypothetical protein